MMEVSLIYNNITLIIFCLAVLLMIYFAAQDQKSLSRGNHVDQKSVIVSIGVLGTFIGIAIGLWHFDTANIDESVPKLLEGLKLAFITSIAGMLISILLSWVQKDKLTGGNDELSVLSEIKGLLVHVQLLEPLIDQVKGLRLEIRDEQKLTRTHIDAGFMKVIETSLAMNEAIDKLATVESVNNFRVDVHEEQLRIRNFLEEQFQETNKSLERAIEVLSKGATEEIIKALENVIADFNKNLMDQFGDNFKELNKAVLSLVQWQENYKEIITKDTELLINIQGSLESSDVTLKNIAARNDEVKAVYERLSHIMTTYDTQLSSINGQMEKYAQIGVEASEAFDKLKDGFEKVQTGMGAQSEALATLTKDIGNKLPESLGQLENTLVGLTSQFAKDYKSFLDNYRNLTP